MASVTICAKCRRKPRKAILTNKDIIALDQDPLGIEALKVLCLLTG